MSSLAEELKSAALRWPIHEARLVRLVESGRCPRRLLQSLAAGLFRSADDFTGDLARLIEAAPPCALRTHLLENLIEESGLQVVPGRGLRFDAEQVHVGWARRFAHACGLPDEALRERTAAMRPPTTRGFNDVFEREGWLGAAAYLLAQEANTPRTLEPMLRGLEAAGFDAWSLMLFSAHIEADERHGGSAFALLAGEVEAGAPRELVMRCVERGARDWWEFHN